MYITYNYFKQWNDNSEITDFKEFYKKFSNTREFGGDNYSNLDHLRKSRFINTLGHVYNIVLRKKPDSIVDIGCGDGINLPIANIFPDVKYYGVDYAEKTIEKATKDYPNIEFTVGDAFELPYEDNSFDIAILSSVLILYENEEDRIKLLSEAKRVLKSDGILVLNVWNDTFLLRNIHAYSRWKAKIKGEKIPEDFNGCHFNRSEILGMVKKAGMSVEERINTAELMGMMESIQYLNKNKFHRNFGKEQVNEKNLSQNIKEDLMNNSGIGYFNIVWTLGRIFPKQFSWMNIYVCKK